MGLCRVPARTPGSLGLNDQGDPNLTSLLGDTPGPLGFNDWGHQELPMFSSWLGRGFHCRAADGAPLAEGAKPPGDGLARQSAATMGMSEAGQALLRSVEALRLTPYDDQTGKDTAVWVAGATIGYGHLILKGEWDTYKSGITDAAAQALFKTDLAPFEALVQKHITASLAQQEFDALALLAFNIGPGGFPSSSVVKLVNDPAAKTGYADLEAAWKAWNKSQGQVMKGLDNRRQCEWNVYTKGVYQRW